MNTKQLSLTGAALFLVACNNQGVSLAFQAVNAAGEDAAPGAEIADEAQTPFVLEELQVHLRDIELDLPAGTNCDSVADQLSEGVSCDEDDDSGEGAKVKVAGPFVLDLLNGTSTPDLAAITVPAGTYQRIDFRIDDGDPDEGLVEAGSALDNRSLVGAMSFDQDGSPVRLRLSLRFNEDIRVENAEGIEVEAGAGALLTQFDASQWLAGLDISGCVARGELVAVDGEIVADDDAPAGSGSCSELEGTLKQNIKESGQLDKD
jgi:hypothetical protein